MRRVAMDGSVLTVGGLVGVDTVVEESVWLPPPLGWSSGIQVSPAHVAELMLTRVLLGRVSDSADFRGGRVIVGDAGKGGEGVGTFAAWVGTSHCVHTMVPLGSWDLPAVLKNFDQLSFNESDDGVQLFDPKDFKAVATRRMMWLGYRDGSCFVRVQEVTEGNLSIVPQGTGTEVAGGEVWRGVGDERAVLVHLSPTTVSLISSHDPQIAAACAERIKLSWAPA